MRAQPPTFSAWLGLFLAQVAYNILTQVSPPIASALFPSPYPDSTLPKALYFDSEGSFKLAVFSDLHYGERDGEEWAQWGVDQDTNSTRVMNSILDSETPDFVVFNGDLVTGENTWKTNVSQYIDKLFAPVKHHAVPFACTYGNHDNAPNISHTEIFLHEKTFYPTLSHTLASPTSSEDVNGVYNYVLPVFERKGSRKLALLLWFFDSRSGTGFPADEQRDDWVDPKVADWIKSTAASLWLEHGSLPPSLVFVHIPVQATRQIQATTVDNHPGYPGINDDSPASHQGENKPEVADPDLPF